MDSQDSYISPALNDLTIYITYGCISPRTLYYRTKENLKHSFQLLTKLLLREFYYSVASVTKNFDRKEDNVICRQIPWDIKCREKVKLFQDQRSSLVLMGGRKKNLRRIPI